MTRATEPFDVEPAISGISRDVVCVYLHINGFAFRASRWAQQFIRRNRITYRSSRRFAFGIFTRGSRLSHPVALYRPGLLAFVVALLCAFSTWRFHVKFLVLLSGLTIPVNKTFETMFTVRAKAIMTRSISVERSARQGLGALRASLFHAPILEDLWQNL